MHKYKVGDKIESYSNGSFEIIEYINSRKIYIRFVDTGFETWTTCKGICSGKIKDRLKPSVYGIGFIGVGKYKAKENGKYCTGYYVWKNILMRCYSNNPKIKRSTYENCTVNPFWHNFQNFMPWFEDNHVEGYEIDKDVLIPGNCEYGPETCRFIPKEINLLIQYTQNKESGLPAGVDFNKASGKYRARITNGDEFLWLGSFKTALEAFEVYKTEKERIIKNKAEEYKDQLPYDVFTSLMNYQIRQYRFGENYV